MKYLEQIFQNNPYLIIFVRLLDIYERIPDDIIVLLERMLILGEKYSNIKLRSESFKNKLRLRMRLFNFMQILVITAFMIVSQLNFTFIELSIEELMVLVILLLYQLLFSVPNKMKVFFMYISS